MPPPPLPFNNADARRTEQQKIVIEKVANSTQRIGVNGYLFGVSKLSV
jgi:hypothetical protein